MIDLAALAKRAGGDFNGHDALIPGPAHTARDRSLSISIGESGKLIWHSFAGDDAKVILPYLKSLGLDAAFSRGSTQAPRAMSSTTTAKAKFAADLARDIWAAAAPLANTPAARYLAGRAMLPPYPASLRYHPRCPDGSSEKPALIAARVMIDEPDQVISVARTFLRVDRADGAVTRGEKKILGGRRGGGVCLGRIDDRVVIAEGIETALSASAIFGMPAIATLGAGSTRALILPARVRRVVIAADNDEPGLRAAHALAVRLSDEGRDVRIETPPPQFKDFNDLTTGKERSVDALRSFRGGDPPHGV